LEAVRNEYPGGELYFTDFETHRLDFSGQLDEALQASYWEFGLIDEEFYRYSAYVFQYHSAVIVDEYQHPDEHLWGNYTDADLRFWLGIVRNAYRAVSGQRDDVSYEINCYAGYHSDGLSIYLFNDRSDRVCRISLDPVTGEVEHISFDD